MPVDPTHVQFYAFSEVFQHHHQYIYTYIAGDVPVHNLHTLSAQNRVECDGCTLRSTTDDDLAEARTAESYFLTSSSSTDDHFNDSGSQKKGSRAANKI